MSDDKEDEFEVRYTPASNELKLKAPHIDKNPDSAFAEASKGLLEMAAGYIDWAQDDFKRLNAAATELTSHPDSKTAKDNVHWIAHDMKGQGGTFGYPLISVVLNNLCLHLNSCNSMSAEDLKIVNLHIEFVNLIITNRLKGKGGEIGEQVIHGMQEIVARKT